MTVTHIHTHVQVLTLGRGIKQGGMAKNIFGTGAPRTGAGI